MKPILYDKTETEFTSAGLATLVDALDCTVEEELNGTYELTLVYPITGRHYDLIQEEQIIGAIHDDTGKIQPFVIYHRTAPLEGKVTFSAHHISYRLSKTTVMPFTATGMAGALAAIKQNIVGSSPFTFETDMITTGEITVAEPATVRSILGGEENTLTQVFGGGEFEFDVFNVIAHQRRGKDTNIEIRYGKNLTDLTQEIDTSETHAAVVPFWKASDGTALVTLPEKYIANEEEAGEIFYTMPLDLSEEFETQPTVEQLRTKAEETLEGSRPWIRSESITVDFVALWQTEEYKRFAELQRASLGDSVSVYYPELGVIADGQRVVRTKYDTLLERFDEITLNEIQDTLADMTDQQISKETNILISAGVNLALQAIQGSLGGYIAIPFDADGKPQRLLILDRPKLSEAVDVLRFDQTGLAFSSGGINGTFTNLITIDGHIRKVIIGSVTTDANGTASIDSLITAGGAPVALYVEGVEAYCSIGGNGSGGFKARFTNAAGEPIASQTLIVTAYSMR